MTCRFRTLGKDENRPEKTDGEFSFSGKNRNIRKCLGLSVFIKPDSTPFGTALSKRLPSLEEVREYSPSPLSSPTGGEEEYCKGQSSRTWNSRKIVSVRVLGEYSSRKGL
jgi:hypothetical protein